MIMGALNMGCRCIRGYFDVLSLDIVPSESFTRHELPALLGTPLVDEHMEKKLDNIQRVIYSLVARAIDCDDDPIWCVVHFLYGWLFD
jgi:hypothetical protein